MKENLTQIEAVLVLNHIFSFEDIGNWKPKQPMLYDVAVVGCGAAGLAALARVTRAGLRAVGLEAAERVGGRVHTAWLGGAVELGAEWIHGETDNPVLELTRAHGVPTTRDTIAFEYRRSDGSTPDQALCDELLACCMLAKDQAEPSMQPLGEYVTDRFREYVNSRPELAREAELCASALSLARLVSNNYDGTDDWNDVSLHGSAQYEELPGHQHFSFGERGYSTLLELLQAEARAPLELRLGAEVARVETRGDRVLLRCADGSACEARAAIVTVSLGVLKERHASLFSPPLPAAKVAAIEALSMGVVGKVCLRYARAWWPRGARKFCGFLWRAADREKAEPWMREILGYSLPSGAADVITLWTSGESAKMVEVMPEKELLRGCKLLLQMFMGPTVTIPDPVGMLRSQWYSSPLTRGSYSHRGRRADALPAAAGDLAAPLPAPPAAPRLLFAGEACSARHFSTVHGAIETGRAAAEAVIAHAAAARRSKI